MKQVELTHTKLNAIAIFNNKSLYLIIFLGGYPSTYFNVLGEISHFCNFKFRFVQIADLAADIALVHIDFGLNLHTCTTTSHLFLEEPFGLR